jgi:hypothetical protein
MVSQPIDERWPELPYAAWKDTRDTLHLWTQAVGKIRLALTPWQNHSWHVALYVTVRGLTTSPIPWRDGSFQIDFDFIDHVLWVRTAEGHFRQVMLKPMSVAEFYEALPMTPIMPIVSGACCWRAAMFSLTFAPAFWARRAQCISSGEALISR